MNNLQIEERVREYIKFKEICITSKIFDIDEIRWLYKKLILGDLIKSKEAKNEQGKM